MTSPPAAERFDLGEYLRTEAVRVNRALSLAMEKAEALLPADLQAPARHAVLSGGKRLRPVLCVTAYRVCGGKSPRVSELAAAVELIHAYSLAHDDLPSMDDAELRRGRFTTHRVYGEDAATRAGAALIPLAALQAWRGALAVGCDRDTARRVVTELCLAGGAGGMVGGQALDLRAEGACVSASELDCLHALKTGALLTASLRIGALAANAPAPILAALEAYGRSVGLAFQVTDDVLDATANAEQLGKRPSDMALGKTTYVAVHGLEAATRRAAAEVGRARAVLETAGIDDPALHALAEYVIERRW